MLDVESVGSKGLNIKLGILVQKIKVRKMVFPLLLCSAHFDYNIDYISSDRERYSLLFDIHSK